jgi:uncharacterized circularly permuted ATP-grasp superfamily protein
MMPAAASYWQSLLRPDVELAPAFGEALTGHMRAARLTFGGRVHCPFLRPFFIDEADERRVRRVAETLADIGERVVSASLHDPALLDQLALTEAEERLVRIEPGYARASTASRLDAFLLPAELKFAEYNAESPAGLGYTETLAEIFDAHPIMARFREKYATRSYPLSAAILDALLASYRDWGGTASPPLVAIVDWREVPTWSEFEILRDRFVAGGVPTIVCDPRDLEFDGARLTAGGRAIDLVYRRVLINDILARPDECRALMDAYRSRAVCVANTMRCKIPHKKAFFALLTDDRNRALLSEGERELVRQHIPWTRLVREEKTHHGDEVVDLVPYVRSRREQLVLKPNDDYGGHGVTLGWETAASAWDAALETAVSGVKGAWVVQERIPVRREIFPQFESGQPVAMRDVLVDLAPYLFRGRLAGFLTRLSASGLANVSSGGGQVPAFVVRPV